MDENEKMVLRRRRNDIAENLEVTHDVLRELTSLGVLSHEVIKDIERDKNNKAGRIVDTLLFVNSPGSFTGICSILRRSSAQCAKLVHEFEADLRLERGEVQPRRDIVDEVKVLVHRKFGQSKRFSEVDKQEVSNLIAVKLQLAQDDWHRETEKIRTELDRLTVEIQQRDERSQHVATALREFICKHETQMTSCAHDMTTTRDLLSQMMEDLAPVDESGNLIPNLERNLKTFFNQVEIVLSHRDLLYYEREKCLRLLGITDDGQKSIQLDELIGQLTGLSVNADMSVESKDSIIARLRRQVELLDREADQHEKQFEAYGQQLADKEREIAELRRHVQIS